MDSKPRVAIYYWIVPQTGYRNDGCALYINYNLRKILNDCKTQKEVMENMSNHDMNVRHLQPHGNVSQFGKYDLHLLVDHGEDALGVPLDFEYPHPNAYWTSDTHIGYEHRLNTAKKFDFVFCAQKRAVEEFIRDGVDPKKVFWLPHAAENDVYRPLSIVERWKWCFIGHFNSTHRIDLMDHFIKEWPLGDEGYIGWRGTQESGRNTFDDANRKFNQAKLIVSDSIKDDINMRTFEALAAKRCLLTNDIPTLGELFEHKKHLWTYRSIEEAVMSAKALLVDDEQRNYIAEQGYKEVISKHTYNHRVRTILKTCLNWVPKEELCLV